MRKFKTIFLVSFVFTLLFAEFSYAQWWGRGRGMGMGMGRMWNPNLMMNYNLPGYDISNFGYPECLNLSQDQIIKLDELCMGYSNSTLMLIDGLRQKTWELENFLVGSSIDEDAFNNLTDGIIKLKRNIQEKDVQHIAKVKSILNVRQKQLVESLSLGYQWSLPMYAEGLGYNAGLGYNNRYGQGYWNNYPGMGYGRFNTRDMGMYGRNILGGPRMGMGPCGLGMGKTGRWNRWWR